MRRLRAWFLLPLLVFLSQVPSSASEPDPPLPCRSIGDVLANKETCHGQPVRLSGNIKIKKNQAGFSLSKGSKSLSFFNKDHPFEGTLIKDGDCVVVEGVYYFQSTKVSSTTFKNKVQWWKVTPCESSEAKEKIYPAKQPNDDMQHKGTSIWVWFVLGGVLLTVVIGAIYQPYYNQRHYRRMGKEFEEYVARLFDDEGWVIEDRSSDTSHTMGRSIIGDLAYDWIIRHRRTGQRFIVQCKYRSRYYRGGIEWAMPYQIRNYTGYQRAKGWEYLVIIGVGGRPSEPEHLYLASLQQLKLPFVDVRDLQPFLRNSKTPFTLDSKGNPI